MVAPTADQAERNQFDVALDLGMNLAPVRVENDRQDDARPDCPSAAGHARVGAEPPIDPLGCLMTEQEFQELFYKLCATQGLNDGKARLAATWTLAARGFVADAVDCLPHLVFVGPPKVARDRAVRLVAESIKDLLVDLTHARKRRGVIRIENYEELSKEDDAIVRDLLLRSDEPMRRPVVMGCGWPPFFPDSTPALVVILDLRP
jgi:hypothetical protein